MHFRNVASSKFLLHYEQCITGTAAYFVGERDIYRCYSIFLAREYLQNSFFKQCKGRGLTQFDINICRISQNNQRLSARGHWAVSVEQQKLREGEEEEAHYGLKVPLMQTCKQSARGNLFGGCYSAALFIVCVIGSQGLTLRHQFSFIKTHACTIRKAHAKSAANKQLT